MFKLFQDGKPLEESPRRKLISEDDNFTLLVYEVKPEDAGNYACVAVNTVGKATCTATLNVEGIQRCLYTLTSDLVLYKLSSPLLKEKPLWHSG